MLFRNTVVSRAVLAIAVIATSGLWAQVAPVPVHNHSSHQHMPTYFVGEAMIAPGPSDPKGQVGSGGRAIAHGAGAVRIRNKKIVRRAPDARLYRTGFRTWEPTMGITQAGTILFDAEDENNVPFVVRSTDKGATWEVTYTGHPFTADPYFYVDPVTSRIFSNDMYPPCHAISYSDDEGETWTEAPLAGCGYNEDHQTLFAGPPPEGGPAPDEYPNVVYLCSIGDGITLASAGSVCSKSLDGGFTFLPTGGQPYMNDPSKTGDAGIPGLCNGANGHGFVGPDGTVYLPRGWCGQPHLAISEDEGLTWTRVQVSDFGMPFVTDVFDPLPAEVYSHEAGVVADNLGNVYYTWVAGDRLPYLAISHDRGLTWDEPMMIAPPKVKEALLPGIAIGRAGRVVIHYMGSTNSPWDGSTMAGDPSSTRWNAYITMTTTALKDRPLFYSGTVNDPREPLWVGPCGPDPSRCGWGDFFDVVIGVEGDPWAVAVDLCNEVECGGMGEAIIGRLAGGPSLID